ncbi:MAG: cytochrome-c peroxidase [Bacteroidetes bacterium]|nr:cytochrome-c peroxidase [Bacteroidota bacterium]MDA1122585.1 cytochrome-c peroxidase [Bacteroidota bacterium]
MDYKALVALFLMGILTYCSSPEAENQRFQKKKAPKEFHFTALPEKVKAPNDNLTTPQKAELGRMLFFDPILSGNKDVSCATCHHPDNGYAEFRDTSIGVNGKGLGLRRVFNQPNEIPLVKRNAHTILNTAFNGINTNNRYTPKEAPMFWDNRVSSLESQALEPIKAFEEMRGPNYVEKDILDEIVTRLKAIPEYQQLFETAFGDEKSINAGNVGKAIAAFERTLVANNSRFDLYMRGDDEAISLSEKDGFELFKKAGCVNCHNGAMFSDFKTHVLGVPENKKLSEPDSGFEANFAFRTASLRNLRFTAPYMHNGSLTTLNEVLEFYEDISQGKERNPSVHKVQFDSLVSELELTVRDMAPIISFLNSLNDSDFDKKIPETVPSGLPVGGNIH